MKFLGIVLLCVGFAVLYGILHDQVTARVCVEYFTIGHPPVFPTTSPTWLGIGWGILATWWAGMLLGVPLAIAARAGSRPKRSTRSLIRPILGLLGIVGGFALLAGVIGFTLGKAGLVWLVEPFASRVPPERHAWYQADLWAHSASYAVGFLGGIVVIVQTWRSRRRLALDS